VNGDLLDRREDRMCRRDAPELGPTGRAWPGQAPRTDDRGTTAPWLRHV